MRAALTRVIDMSQGVTDAAAATTARQPVRYAVVADDVGLVSPARFGDTIAFEHQFIAFTQARHFSSRSVSSATRR